MARSNATPDLHDHARRFEAAGLQGRLNPPLAKSPGRHLLRDTTAVPVNTRVRESDGRA